VRSVLNYLIIKHLRLLKSQVDIEQENSIRD